LREVEEAENVDRVGIGCQKQRLGIHQFGEDEDLIVLDADAQETLAECMDADALQGVREHTKRMREVDVLVDLVQGRLAGRSVLELERADARLDLVRRGERRRDWRLRDGFTSTGNKSCREDDCECGAR